MSLDHGESFALATLVFALVPVPAMLYIIAQTLAHGRRAALAAVQRILGDSIVVEVLNPKTAIFFMAFLPQFVDATASSPVWLQVLVLGAILNLAVSSAELTAAIVASNALERLGGSGPHPRLVRGGGGSILVGLGVVLALRPG